MARSNTALLSFLLPGGTPVQKQKVTRGRGSRGGGQGRRFDRFFDPQALRPESLSRISTPLPAGKKPRETTPRSGKLIESVQPINYDPNSPTPAALSQAPVYPFLNGQANVRHFKTLVAEQMKSLEVKDWGDAADSVVDMLEGVRRGMGVSEAYVAAVGNKKLSEKAEKMVLDLANSASLMTGVIKPKKAKDAPEGEVAPLEAEEYTPEIKEEAESTEEQVLTPVDEIEEIQKKKPTVPWSGEEIEEYERRQGVAPGSVRSMAEIKQTPGGALGYDIGKSLGGIYKFFDAKSQLALINWGYADIFSDEQVSKLQKLGKKPIPSKMAAKLLNQPGSFWMHPRIRKALENAEAGKAVSGPALADIIAWVRQDDSSISQDLRSRLVKRQREADSPSEINEAMEEHRESFVYIPVEDIYDARVLLYPEAAEYADKDEYNPHPPNSLFRLVVPDPMAEGGTRDELWFSARGVVAPVEMKDDKARRRLSRAFNDWDTFVDYVQGRNLQIQNQTGREIRVEAVPHGAFIVYPSIGYPQRLVKQYEDAPVGTVRFQSAGSGLEFQPKTMREREIKYKRITDLWHRIQHEYLTAAERRKLVKEMQKAREELGITDVEVWEGRRAKVFPSNVPSQFGVEYEDAPGLGRYRVPEEPFGRITDDPRYHPQAGGTGGKVYTERQARAELVRRRIDIAANKIRRDKSLRIAEQVNLIQEISAIAPDMDATPILNAMTDGDFSRVEQEIDYWEAGGTRSEMEFLYDPAKLRVNPPEKPITTGKTRRMVYDPDLDPIKAVEAPKGYTGPGRVFEVTGQEHRTPIEDARDVVEGMHPDRVFNLIKRLRDGGEGAWREIYDGLLGSFREQREAKYGKSKEGVKTPDDENARALMQYLNSWGERYSSILNRSVKNEDAIIHHKRNIKNAVLEGLTPTPAEKATAAEIERHGLMPEGGLRQSFDEKVHGTAAGRRIAELSDKYQDRDIEEWSNQDIKELLNLLGFEDDRIRDVQLPTKPAKIQTPPSIPIIPTGKKKAPPSPLDIKPPTKPKLERIPTEELFFGKYNPDDWIEPKSYKELVEEFARIERGEPDPDADLDKPETEEPSAIPLTEADRIVHGIQKEMRKMGVPPIEKPPARKPPAPEEPQIIKLPTERPAPKPAAGPPSPRSDDYVTSTDTEHNRRQFRKYGTTSFAGNEKVTSHRASPGQGLGAGMYFVLDDSNRLVGAYLEVDFDFVAEHEFDNMGRPVVDDDLRGALVDEAEAYVGAIVYRDGTMPGRNWRIVDGDRNTIHKWTEKNKYQR